MKKILIFLVLVLGIVVSMIIMYTNYKAQYNNTKRENLEFENYYQKEIYGTNIATIINKAIDNNNKNNVQIDNSNKYIENDENSIKIDIYIVDNDTTYDMESLYNRGIVDFVQYYSSIKFKCTKVEYHKNTKRVKYMYFEQITTQ